MSSRWTLVQSGCLYTLSHSPLPGNSIEYTSSSPSVAYVAGSLLLAKSWCSELFLWLPLSLTLTLFDFGSLTELFGGLLLRMLSFSCLFCSQRDEGFVIRRARWRTPSASVPDITFQLPCSKHCLDRCLGYPIVWAITIGMPKCSSIACRCFLGICIIPSI